MILNVCNDPDLLSIFIVFKQIINLIQIIAPIALIIFIMIDILKAVIGHAEEMSKAFLQSKNRLIAAAMIFLVPTILNLLINTLSLTNLSYTECINNATPEKIDKFRIDIAEEAVIKAEKDKNKTNVIDARGKVNIIQNNDKVKIDFLERLEKIEAKLLLDEQNRYEDAKDENENTRNNLEFDEIFSKGTAIGCTVVRPVNIEPDPSIAINYWVKKNRIEPKQFVYPKDKNTKRSLGAWPKDYKQIPEKLTSPKVYRNTFIWPVTPENGKYNFVYEHGGIDIMAKIGTPIYAPATGNLRYSEWGHTVNNGCDETRYSVTINLDNSIYLEGINVKRIYLTHMSGIINRCSDGDCNIRVNKGDLIGFVGNAAGSNTDGIYAPHLHMTFYNSGYSNRVSTRGMERIFDIHSGTNRKAGE